MNLTGTQADWHLLHGHNVGWLDANDAKAVFAINVEDTYLPKPRHRGSEGMDGQKSQWVENSHAQANEISRPSAMEKNNKYLSDGVPAPNQI